MDIEELYTKEAHEAGAVVQITSPDTGKELGFSVSIVGPDSKAWRTQYSAHVKRVIDSKADGKDIDSDQFEVEFLASVTVGWSGFTRAGEEVEFSRKECEKLYDNAPWLRDQVNAFAGNRANFTKG